MEGNEELDLFLGNNVKTRMHMKPKFHKKLIAFLV